MKRLLLLVGLMVLATLVGMVGFSRAQTSSPISDAVSALQSGRNPTVGAVNEPLATVNAGVQVKPKEYYLTKNTFTGSEAIMGCDSGFHMASISEIQDASTLQYANRSTAAYESLLGGQRLGPPSNGMGWVRSGVYPPAGFVYDCEDFLDIRDNRSGTTLAHYDFPFNSDALQPVSYPTKGWYTTQYACSQPEPVWCVEDPE